MFGYKDVYNIKWVLIFALTTVSISTFCLWNTTYNFNSSLECDREKDLCIITNSNIYGHKLIKKVKQSDIISADGDLSFDHYGSSNAASKGSWRSSAPRNRNFRYYVTLKLNNGKEAKIFKTREYEYSTRTADEQDYKVIEPFVNDTNNYLSGSKKFYKWNYNLSAKPMHVFRTLSLMVSLLFIIMNILIPFSVIILNAFFAKVPHVNKFFNNLLNLIFSDYILRDDK